MTERKTLTHWLPALAFGVIMFLAVRLVKKPLVIPIVLAVGLALFAIGMLVTGSSIDDARNGFWMLGPYRSGWLFQPWTFRALTGADWWAVLGQAAGIVTVVFVAVIGVLFNISGTEILLDRDLDANTELRDAGLLNVVSGVFGGIPGYHALSLTTLADRMNVDARATGLDRLARPAHRRRVRSRRDRADPAHDRRRRAGVPRSRVHRRVGLGQAANAAEARIRRRAGDPRGDHREGVPPRVVIGLVMAVVLFAVSYGRIELVHEVAFGDTCRSNVDRPPAERAALRTMGARVQILRVQRVRLLRVGERPAGADPQPGGHGTAALPADGPPAGDGRGRLGGGVVREGDPPRGGERVRARVHGCPDPVRTQLERGGVVASEGVVRFEPDLDRGLQRCEDVLLEEAQVERPPSTGQDDALEGLPPGLQPYLERVPSPREPC